ncbi:Uncharacterised protein [Candidatus Gugararchaeum adminiculabundum]|nr:Uncharacterised protein [Candidatus Gugararchaeum adminiculabundum]
MSVSRELTFFDLMVLERIDRETYVERFGSKINASFFDAANVLGTMKLKGYINIQSSPGLSPVSCTPDGLDILQAAAAKAKEEVDALDVSITRKISSGAKDPAALAAELNLRSGDLAYRLYKLVRKGLIDYELRATKVSVMMTESGFVKVNGEPEPNYAEVAKAIQ